MHNVKTISTINSNHDPLYCKLRTNNTTKRNLGRFYDYSTTNWSLYRGPLDQILVINNTIIKGQELKYETTKLTTAIQCARDSTIKQKTRTTLKENLPQDITDLIKNKNK